MTAVIMTFNLTTRYYTSSRDMAIIDMNNADLRAIEATFNKDFNSTTDKSYKPTPGHDLIWSPTTAQKDLLGIITGATHTLLVENEELGAVVIVNALTAACKRGVKVSLAMTDTSLGYHANYTALESAGCGVHIGANNDGTLYIHAKLLVADLGTASAVGYLGSINFSAASMTENREAGLYLRDPALLTRLAATVTSDYNQFPSYTEAVTLSNTAEARP